MFLDECTDASTVHGHAAVLAPHGRPVNDHVAAVGDCEARRAPAGSAASTPIDAHIPYG